MFSDSLTKIKRRTKQFIIGISVILFIYILFCVLLYFIQDTMIFYPQKLTSDSIAVSAETNNIENLALTMKDGCKLQGWLVKNNPTAKSGLLLYFGGNAEEVSHLVDKTRQFENWDVALVNYRGYGLSDGVPTESTLYSDSLEIYDTLADREDIDADRIVAMGRSIGTGVASYLAEKRKTSGVILVSPYDSLPSVAQEKYPVFPIHLLLKYKFNTIARAPSINSPLLIIVGSADSTIPPWHSRKVAEKWGGKVEYKEIGGEDHNSISSRQEYWDIIGDYLRRLS